MSVYIVLFLVLNITSNFKNIEEYGQGQHNKYGRCAADISADPLASWDPPELGQLGMAAQPGGGLPVAQVCKPESPD